MLVKVRQGVTPLIAEQLDAFPRLRGDHTVQGQLTFVFSLVKSSLLHYFHQIIIKRIRASLIQRIFVGILRVEFLRIVSYEIIFLKYLRTFLCTHVSWFFVFGHMCHRWNHRNNLF